MFDLCLQDFLWDEESLVFGYHGGTHGATEGVFDLHAVGFTTEENADRGVLVGALDIAIECFKIELELTKVTWVELAGFEFYCYKALEASVVEKQVPSTSSGQAHLDCFVHSPNNSFSFFTRDQPFSCISLFTASSWDGYSS